MADPKFGKAKVGKAKVCKAKVCKAKVGKAKVCKAKVCKAKVGEVNQTLEIEILSILEHLMVATQEPSVDNIIMVHKEAVNIIMGDGEILSLLTIYGMAIQEPSVESDLFKRLINR